MDWVVEALSSSGGGGNAVSVAKHIWKNHEADLREAGDLFYKWQYDIRWAATELRDRRIMKGVDEPHSLPWELA